jgi:FkbH-like protein
MVNSLGGIKQIYGKLLNLHHATRIEYSERVSPPTEMVSIDASLDREATVNGELLSSACRKRLSQLIEAQKSEILVRWYECQFEESRLRRFEVAGVENVDRQTLVHFFLTPLLNLLTAFIKTGKTYYRDVYLDERLRYAPHRADISVRKLFFSEVIPSDEDTIVRQACAAPEDASMLRTLLAQLHAPLLSSSMRDSVRLLALGDCLMSEVRVFLPGQCRSAGIDVDMRMLYFSAAMGRELETQEAIQFLSSNPTDLLALSFLTYVGLPRYQLLLREAHRLSRSDIRERVMAIVGLMRRFIFELREKTEATILLHNACGLPLTRFRRYFPIVPPLSSSHRKVLRPLNDSIRELAENIPNTLLIDEQLLITAGGYRNNMAAVIPRGIYKQSFFHTSRFGQILAGAYAEIIMAHRDLAKAKVLLVDFDDTLWKGIMADGQVSHFQERQRLLRRLKERGMLLVAVSKNDPRNVRWSEMALQPSDFALLKINWNTKIQSIQETGKELDLGTDSFVLIDDNTTERGLVHSRLPSVRTLDSAASSTWRSLEFLLSFPNVSDTEEARTRTEHYRAQSARRQAMNQDVDYPTMMASLGLEARFGLASHRDLNRIAELIQRTNQFNSTTIRYSRAQLQEFLSDKFRRLYVAELSDKYSKLGLVAVVIIDCRDTEAIFDSFVMSCRAMGFGLERLVLRLVLDAEKDATRFVGRFVRTDRNLPASTLFTEAGFRQLSKTEFSLGPGDPKPEAPPWFTVLASSARE